MAINEILLKRISEEFKLTKVDIGEDSYLKKKGMKFQIEVYKVEDIGQLFLMKMSGMFGLMKMETMTFTINQKDVPLIDADYIKAFGKETFIVELYNFMINPYKEQYLEEYRKIKELDNDLLEYEAEPGWYEAYRYPETYKKTGKKLTNRYINTANKYIDTFIKQIKELELCDKDLKQKRIEDFANELFSKGGPAVNTFKKLFGVDTAKRVVLNYMYNVK